MHWRVMGEGVPSEKLVVSIYLQYALVTLGVLLLFAFVWQLGGVLLTFLLAAVLAYVLSPLVRQLEEQRVPRIFGISGAVLLHVVPATARDQTVELIYVAGRTKRLVGGSRGKPTILRSAAIRREG